MHTTRYIEPHSLAVFRELRSLTVDLMFAAGLILMSCRLPLQREDFSPENVQSLRIYDRRNFLLRECLNDGEGHASWKSLKEISPVMVQATIAVEDRRFFSHPGIDPLAVVRAIRDNLRALSFRSGGSTLTQQVIRNVYHQSRTIPHKVLELWYAVRLEGMFSKDEILEQYLNRAPYGNQLVGVEAAAQSYFGKPSRDLSLAEAAFLAGLPNSPSALNPRRNLEPALARQRSVLRRMLDQSLIPQEEFERAAGQPLRINDAEASLHAAHVTDMILARFQTIPSVAEVHTTIDYPLQRHIQLLLQSHVRSLRSRNVTNAAAAVIDNSTGEIRALVGSVDYFDEAHSGQVNGALALRQPGSSIKPLMYALALEQGFSAADILADIPTAIPDHEGEYVPENYDRKFHGPVRLRSALACSYNVPAVRVLREVGTELFLRRLQLAGISTLTQPADFYGFGLTLGNGEVTLLELTNAYSVIANHGVWRPALLVASATSVRGDTVASEAGEWGMRPQHRAYDEKSAFIITDILSDPVARRPAFGSWFRFPFPCAVKTGTTKDYRDNWTLGYTTMYTVGIWVGNFDGSVMHGVSGVTGAGQIFSDVMNLLHSGPAAELPPEFRVPDGMEQKTVCSVSGKLPGSSCKRTVREWFIQGQGPTKTCDVHKTFRIRLSTGASETKTFEVYGPEYQEWAASMRIPLPPPDARRSAVPAGDMKSGGAHGSLAILAPANGDMFKLDPVLRREYQTLRIVGNVPTRYRGVLLRIDGHASAPYKEGGVSWPLCAGSHVLQLVGVDSDRKVESEPVIIHVE